MARGTSLIERAATIDAVTAHVGGGRGSVALLGPAGIGKTAVLDHVVATADPTTAVGAAAGSRMEQGLSHGITLQLLGRLIAGHDGRPFEGAASGARALFEASDRSLPQGLALLHALHTLCLNLSRRHPLLLTVDDLQWADPESMEFLSYLARRIDDAPIAVVLAARTDEAGPHDLLLRETLADVERVELEPLSRTGATHLIEAHLTGLDPAQIDRWWTISGGVPLFLLELVRRHREGDDDHGSDSVLELVQQRLRRLTPAARTVATCLSILGPGATPHDIARLAGQDVASTLQHLDALATAALVDPALNAFAHPVFSDALLTATGRGEVVHLRIKAAELLRDSAPLRAAAQLAAAEPPVVVGERWAADVLHEAALDALGRGGAAEALTYLDLAREEPAVDELRLRILLASGSLRARLRDPAALNDFDRAGRLAERSSERGHVALLHAEALFHLGDPDACSRRCVEAVAELGDSDRELTLQLHTMALNAAGMTGHYPMRPETLLDEVSTGASPAERAVLAHIAYAAAAEGSWTRDEVTRLARRALTDDALFADAGASSPSYIYCGIALAWSDEFDTVIDVTDRAIEIGQRDGSLMGIAYATALQAWALMRSGRLTDAEQAATRVIDDLADADPMSYGVSVACLVQTLLDQGRVPDARQTLVDTGMDGPLPPLSTVAFLVLARGNLLLAEGDAAAAAREFESVRDTVGRAQYANPAALAWRSALAAARLARNQRDEAYDLAAEEVDRARAYGADRALSIALRVLASCVEPTASVPILRESVDAGRRAGAATEQARSQHDLGIALGATDPDSARSILAEAMDAADRCGAAGLSASAHDQIVRLGGRPRRRRIVGVDALTRQERRVALLAAAGARNRDIADELFISMATVETHLTSVYRKLGIASRRELAAAMDAGSA